MLHISTKQKRSLSLVLFLTMLLTFCGMNFSTQTAKAAADIDHVQDLADILTDEEEAALREECISHGDLNEIDIFILTTNSVPKNRKVYIEDFYDSHDDILTDAVFVLVNMDPDERGVEMQGYGQCEFSLSDDRIDKLLDGIVPYLSDGAYYDAFCYYIQEVDYYMSIEATSDYVHTEQDNINYDEHYAEEVELTPFEYMIGTLIVAARTSAILTLIIVVISLFRRGGSVTTNGNTYMDVSNSRVLGHWDRYIRTTTTRTRKPKDDGGSSHIGGGVSSGGHSHSGGGRSF